MAVLKHDATVGRLLFIDKNNKPDLTAEEFLKYMDEGFVPVVRETQKANSYFNVYLTTASYKINLSTGVVSLTEIDGTIEFQPANPVEDDHNPNSLQ